MPPLPRLLVFAACLLSLANLSLRADPVALRAHPLALESTELPSPAIEHSLAPQLATAPDSTVYLSWVQRVSETKLALRFSRLDLAQRRWSEARTIAQGENWFVNWADTPQLAAAGEGRLAAVWFVNNPPTGHEHGHHGSYHALVSFSHDDGATWSEPVRLSPESHYNEFVALAPLPEGRWLAAWLDGRAKHQGGDAQQLYARILGTHTPDALVDDRVCDCCPTTLAAFPDGSVLLAYRDRSPEEVRDMRVATFRDGRWSESRPLNHDGWKIAACPVNGPVLQASGGRVAAAWFTAADNDARVLASTSPDAGARFLLPARLDETKPVGRVDTVLLRDGSQWVSWLEQTGAVRLRRLAPSGEASVAASFGGGEQNASRAGGIPRLALAKDYDAGPAQLVLARTEAGEPSRVTTHLITLPAARDLAAKDCDCDPDAAEASRGHALKGRIVGVLPERQSVLVKHEEIPGVMRAMTMEFKVAPELLATLREGQEILARMERRDDRKWWLFQVKRLGTAHP
ncbi:MAG TPA: copper-binding protein [Opitutaceae bacterium]